MNRLHISNIGRIGGITSEGVRMRNEVHISEWSTIEDAWIQVEGQYVVEWGSMAEEPILPPNTEIWDAHGAWVIPAFVDPHTHLVHSGTREQEWTARLKGATYQEIAASGGGIMQSVRNVRAADVSSLLDESRIRLETIRSMGVGSLEIKSGYGLDFDTESKMMRVTQALAAEYPEMNILSTCLALHATPPEYAGDADAYVKRVTQEWIPIWVGEGLIDFVDIFCEQGYFGLDHLDMLLDCANRLGLGVRVHVNQFSVMGAVKRAVDGGALSVDHLEEFEGPDLEALKKGATFPVLLPGCSFFLGIPYAPGRLLADAGLPVVVGSDYNPGSSPGLNPFLTLSLSCLKLGLMPEEALNAMTLNAAASLNISDRTGSVGIGKEASMLFISGLREWSTLPYHFGQVPPMRVMLKGRFI
ncbi:MAG: imidazolonepropionase [Sphingomonadales bacterium]|nr:imidazolonepropionase [Sphingomonadales bacterium]